MEYEALEILVIKGSNEKKIGKILKRRTRLSSALRSGLRRAWFRSLEHVRGVVQVKWVS